VPSLRSPRRHASIWKNRDGSRRPDLSLVVGQATSARHLENRFASTADGLGRAFGSELKTLTKPRSGRKPDVSVFLGGRRPPPRRGPIREPADILIEVVSPSPKDERRDRVEKMAEYAAFGVKYYWLVDPALGSFEVFERDAAGNYAKRIGATSGRLDQIPGCSELSVDLDALWTELGRLSEDE
jgi:Uma2 family endonuclease